MSEHQNIGKIENRLDGTTWYDQDYVDNLQQENKQLKECYCERTDCIGRIKDSRKYDSVKQQLDKATSILTELEEHCEIMLRIFEKMSLEQKQEQLDKYVIYDKFLGRIQELKEKYK